MYFHEAIALRINELRNNKSMSIYALSIKSKLSYSTVHNIVAKKTKAPMIRTLDHIIHGLEISYREFYDTEYFDQHLPICPVNRHHKISSKHP
jgi:transcriptional regulator with XRE-family HTH domain